MPLNGKRWKGIHHGTVVVVGNNGSRRSKANIKAGEHGKSVKVNLRGLPCGLYYVQFFNQKHNKRSATRAWSVSANHVTRLILVGPNKPLGDIPL